MNTLSGEIAQLDHEGKLTIVQVNVNSLLFTSVIIDDGNMSDFLRVGNQVKVMFKESEVIVAVGKDIQISLRNQLPGTIQKIEYSNLLCKLTIDTAAGMVKSMITKNAVDSLGLQQGKEVIAMVKTNEILLSS